MFSFALSLAAEKLKFFYKTVEWLPGQIEKQCADSLFEHISISNDLLLGQRGPRVMWAEVKELITLDEKKRAAKAAAGEGDDDGVPIISDLPATRYAPASFTVDLQEPKAAEAAPPAAPPPAPAQVPPPALLGAAARCLREAGRRATRRRRRARAPARPRPGVPSTRRLLFTPLRW